MKGIYDAKILVFVDDFSANGTYFSSHVVVQNLCKKMVSLVTLFSAGPEIHYVAVCNINLVVQKLPTILAHVIMVRFRQVFMTQVLLIFSDEFWELLII